MKTAIYPGSFDPVTLGHINIIKRAAVAFDKVIVCVMVNSEKNGGLFTPEERIDLMRKSIQVSNVEFDVNYGLVAEYAKAKGARVLDMIDDVKAELPVEIKRAKDLVANRNDYIASAKREADSLRQQAEDYAKRLVNEDAIVREAEKKADEILSDAEEQCRMLKAAASEYCEDTLRRMEEAVADAYDEVKHSRAKFRSALSAASGGPAPRSQPAPRRAMYDAEADEDED